MCETSESFYVDGDIVWVKLGPCWWPGEVWGGDRVNSEDLKGFKKPPIAVVKFFQEDTFEYVRNFSHIYKYNCSKKDEFIRKGLDMYRTKNKMMEKFPGDLGIAEEKTGGNPNIADSSEFAPNTKADYKSLFGTPEMKSKKKGVTKVSPTNTPLKTHWKLKALTKLGTVSRTPDRPAVNITHPRFSLQGGDTPEHEIRYLASPTPAISPIAKTFTCPLCDYKCNRLNVIVIHTKQFHSTGSKNTANYSPSSGISTISKSKQKGTKDKSTPKGRPPSELTYRRNSNDTVKTTKQRTETTPNTPKRRGRKSKKKVEDVVESSKKLIKTDVEIKTSLLADWGDDSDEEPLCGTSSSTINIHNESKVEDTVTKEVPAVDNTKNEEPVEENLKVLATDCAGQVEEDTLLPENDTAVLPPSTIKERSCFDFVEEEEVAVISKNVGRKIPRLISKKTKKEFEYTIETDNDFSLCDNKNKPEKEGHIDITEAVVTEIESPSKIKESSEVDSHKETEKTESNLEVDFKTMLDETMLPEIPFDSDMTSKFSENKPREIMSPKERGKRIFKSKQIFKSRMQQQQLELERAKQLETNNENKLFESSMPSAVVAPTSDSKTQAIKNIEECKEIVSQNESAQASVNDIEDEMQIDEENEDKNIDHAMEVCNLETSDNIEVLQIIDENKDEILEFEDLPKSTSSAETENNVTLNLHNTTEIIIPRIDDISSANTETTEKNDNKSEPNICKNLLQVEIEHSADNNSITEEKFEILTPLEVIQSNENVISAENTINVIDITEKNHQVSLTEIMDSNKHKKEDDVIQETTGLYDITREQIYLSENDKPMNVNESLDTGSDYSINTADSINEAEDKQDIENLASVCNDYLNTTNDCENEIINTIGEDNRDTVERKNFMVEEDYIVEENKEIMKPVNDHDIKVDDVGIHEKIISEGKNFNISEDVTDEIKLEASISDSLQNNKEVDMIKEHSVQDAAIYNSESSTLPPVDERIEKVTLNINELTVNVDDNFEKKEFSLNNLNERDSIRYETNEQIAEIDISKLDVVVSEKDSNLTDNIILDKENEHVTQEIIPSTDVKNFITDFENKLNEPDMSQNISDFKDVADNVIDNVPSEECVENKCSSARGELSEENFTVKPFVTTNQINLSESTLTEHDLQVAKTLMAFKETESKKDVIEMQTIPEEQSVPAVAGHNTGPLFKIDFHSKIDESTINDAAECLMNFSESVYSENNHEKSKKTEDDLPADIVPKLMPISEESESNVAKVEEFINLFSSQSYTDNSLAEKTKKESAIPCELSDQLLLKESEKKEAPQRSANDIIKSEPIKSSIIQKPKSAVPIKLSGNIQHTQSLEQVFENIEEGIPVHKIINETDMKTVPTPETKLMEMFESKIKTTEHIIPSKSSKSKVKIISTKIIKPPIPASDRPKEKILNQTPGIHPKKQFVIKMKSEKSSDVFSESKKRTFDQIDDIQTFVIEKPKCKQNQITLKEKLIESPSPVKSPTKLLKKRIIRKMPSTSGCTSVPIKPSTSKNSISEESVFDINSMPIVLSDELLTAENINNMPIVLSSTLGQTGIVDNSSLILRNQNMVVYEPSELPEIKSSTEADQQIIPSPKKGNIKQMHVIKRPIVQPTKGKIAETKTNILNKNQKTYNSPTQSKLLKTNTTIITQPGKPSKFIVVPTSSSATGTKYTVGKRPQPKHVVKQLASSQVSPSKPSQMLSQGTDLDSSGNTIMLVTNAQGIQTKVVLTPEQQKLLFKGQKVTGTRSSVTSQTIVTSKGAIINSKQSAPIVSVSNVASQMILTSRGQVISSAPNTLTGVSVKNVQTVTTKIIPNQKQKSITSNLSQTILTSKGQLITPGSTVLTSTGQIIQQNQQVVTSKGNILTPLTPAQMKQFKSGKSQNKIQIQNQKIIVNPKKPQILNQKPTTSTVVRGHQKVVQPVIREGKPMQQISKSGAGPIIQKVNKEKGISQHVKLSSQQIAKMEELGYIDSTVSGKVINSSGLKFLNLSTQTIQSHSDKEAASVNKEKKIIVTKPSRKNVSTFKDNTGNNTPGILQSRLMSEPKQLSRTLLLKNQTSVPPLAPISDTSSPPVKKQKLGYDVNTLPDLAEITNVSTIPEQFKREEPRATETIVQKSQDIVLEKAIENKTPALPDVQTEQPSTLDVNALTSIPDGQLLAVPGENFGGPANSFFLCSVEDNGNLTPIDNQPLYLDSNNQLVPASTLTSEITGSQIQVEQQIQIPEVQQSTELMNEQQIVQTPTTDLLPNELENQIVINADGQQIVLTQQNLLALTEQQILTTDGEQLILQGSAQQILAALAGQDLNLLTGQQILLNEQFTNFENQEHGSNKDILAAALANTNVFQNENVAQDMEAITYQTLPNIEYKHSSVSETSTTLNQPPIMSPLELPSTKTKDRILKTDKIEDVTFGKNLDESLAVIGVNANNVPTSLDLPITVTNPKIAPKTTDPLKCDIYHQSYNTIISKEIEIFHAPQTSTALEHHFLQNDMIQTSYQNMPSLSGDESEKAEQLLDSTITNTSVEGNEFLIPDAKPIDEVDEKLSSISSKKKQTEESMELDTSNINVLEPLVTSSISMPLLTEDLEPESNEPVSHELLEPIISDINQKHTATKRSAENVCSLQDSITSTLPETQANIMEKIASHTILVSDLVANESTENKSNTDSKFSISDKQIHMNESDIFDSESVISDALPETLPKSNADQSCALSESAAVQTERDLDRTLTSNNIDSHEIISSAATSELNIITQLPADQLNIGSENSELLTPETIPETEVGSPLCSGPMQNYSDSSNSDEIPLQPKLIYTSSEILEDCENRLHSDADSIHQDIMYENSSGISLQQKLILSGSEDIRENVHSTKEHATLAPDLSYEPDFVNTSDELSNKRKREEDPNESTTEDDSKVEILIKSPKRFKFNEER